ncbi:MAG: ParB/RepB/Spo0J family partition protein [Woeseiaceae bacterium]|nr:ParB/RepB/Spo0J family partition protein [Woeseiaceae bacterium]
MSSRKRLGRGLDALLGNRQSVSSGEATRGVAELAVDALARGHFQPRQTVDDDALAELVQSIRQQGVLQPLVVRPVSAGKTSHEIVAGERRWRAARLAGLKTVPVVVRELDDASALAVALIENLQREDLSAIEIAESLRRLTEEFGMTHKQAADAVGRSRASVSNYLRLLELDGEARRLLAEGKLDMGHARALLPLDVEQQEQLAKTIAAKGLSVREVEQRVAEQQHRPRDVVPRREVDLQTRWLQEQFAKELGVRVAIRRRKDGGNSLGISFDDLDQLRALLKQIETLVDQVVDTAGPRVKSG